MIAYSGVLSSGKMIADEIITSSSLYDFREEWEPNQRGSRRIGSLNGVNQLRKKTSPANIPKNRKSFQFFASIFNGSSNPASPSSTNEF